MFKRIACILVLCFALAGCANSLHEANQGYSTMGAAATGALAGAVVGGILVPGIGAAPGAIVGGVAGGFMGFASTEDTYEEDLAKGHEYAK